MPELPDITVYIEALQVRVVGQPLEEARLNTPAPRAAPQLPITVPAST